MFYPVDLLRADVLHASRYDGVDPPVARSVLRHPRWVDVDVPVHVYEVQDPSPVRPKVEPGLLVLKLPACHAEECWEREVSCDKAAQALQPCPGHRPPVLPGVYFLLHLLPVEAELRGSLLPLRADVLHRDAAKEERLEVAEGVCWQVFGAQKVDRVAEVCLVEQDRAPGDRLADGPCDPLGVVSWSLLVVHLMRRGGADDMKWHRGGV